MVRFCMVLACMVASLLPSPASAHQVLAGTPWFGPNNEFALDVTAEELGGDVELFIPVDGNNVIYSAYHTGTMAFRGSEPASLLQLVNCSLTGDAPGSDSFTLYVDQSQPDDSNYRYTHSEQTRNNAGTTSKVAKTYASPPGTSTVTATDTHTITWTE